MHWGQSIMEFYSPLYVGASVRHPEKVMRRLRKRSLMISAYVILLAAGEDLLEIYDARIFAQHFYRDQACVIVGIADNYEEAVELIVRITEESLAARGDCELKKYLLERMQERV